MFTTNFRLENSWDTDGKLFLHRSVKGLSLIQEMIKTLQDNTLKDQENQNYIIQGDSAFINSNPTLKKYPTMVKTQILCNNTFMLLIIKYISDNKLCISTNIPLLVSEACNSNHYNINEITFTDKHHGIHLLTIQLK